MLTPAFFCDRRLRSVAPKQARATQHPQAARTPATMPTIVRMDSDDCGSSTTLAPPAPRHQGQPDSKPVARAGQQTVPMGKRSGQEPRRATVVPASDEEHADAAAQAPASTYVLLDEPGLHAEAGSDSPDADLQTEHGW